MLKSQVCVTLIHWRRQIQCAHRIPGIQDYNKSKITHSSTTSSTIALEFTPDRLKCKLGEKEKEGRRKEEHAYESMHMKGERMQEEFLQFKHQQIEFFSKA